MASTDTSVTWETYDMHTQCSIILNKILNKFAGNTHSLPVKPLREATNSFVSSSNNGHDKPMFPVPFKETETAAALKYIEGSMALALYNLRSGRDTLTDFNSLQIDLTKATLFLMETYATVLHEQVDQKGALSNSIGKQSTEAKKYMGQEKYDTDFHGALSKLENRMIAGIGFCEDGSPYHRHHSLEQKEWLDLLRIPSGRFIGIENDAEAINAVHQSATAKWDIQKLDEENMKRGQAGAPVNTWKQFLKTEHGKVITKELPWTVSKVEIGEEKVEEEKKEEEKESCKKLKRPLEGKKVVEFCRVIAGPTVGRILAEYGADVIKIIRPRPDGPDVPWFQIDVNMGKHSIALDLKKPAHREFFVNKILRHADIILDGYSPQAIPKLLANVVLGDVKAKATGSESQNDYWVDLVMKKLYNKFGKHHIYLVENCFGHVGPCQNRRGWQQTADSYSGVADEQGRFMFPESESPKPVIPPFPMSDYGCGCMGAIATIVGLINQHREGGSWIGRTSLLQYDVLLLEQGLYSEDIKTKLRSSILAFQEPDTTLRQRYFGSNSPRVKFFEVQPWASVDDVSGAALWYMLHRFPEMFDAKNRSLYELWKAPMYVKKVKEGEKAVDPKIDPSMVVQAVKPVVQISTLNNKHRGPPRPNAMLSPSHAEMQQDPWAEFKTIRRENLRL
ncbi:hypothetical protein F5Y16DRAFT_415518 [Xylariaceae sp. FL0255]|nr:hypothetical protein F5Y16DRAFT_415518 [Xylariaceae sp. FL0255]